MPGTSGNPVRLDHYQNIIEVHWNDEQASGPYISRTFAWTQNSAASTQAGIAPGIELLPCEGAKTNLSLTSISFGPSMANGSTTWFVVGLGNVDVVISGIPSAQSQSFGSWSKVGMTGSFGDGCSAWYAASWNKYGDFDGTVIVDEELPSPISGTQWKSVTSIPFSFGAENFTGAPITYFNAPGGTAYLWAAFAGKTNPLPTDLGAAVESFTPSFDLSGVTAVIGGDTYNVVGTSFKPNEEGYFNFPARTVGLSGLLVLFKKVGI